MESWKAIITKWKKYEEITQNDEYQEKPTCLTWF